MSPSLLARAHVEAQSRLRDGTAAIALAAWDALPDHDEPSVALFCDTVVPVVEAGQRRAIQMLDGYCAQESGREALGLDPDDLVGSASRNGVDPNEVYRRPFVELWSLLKSGHMWGEANHAARARLRTAVETDVLRAQMLAAERVVELDPGTNSMERVLKGTCAKCIEAQRAGGTVQVAIHAGCQCSVVPSARPPIPVVTTEQVKTEQHGELGPVLVERDYKFMDEAEANKRKPESHDSKKG